MSDDDTLTPEQRAAYQRTAKHMYEDDDLYIEPGVCPGGDGPDVLVNDAGGDGAWVRAWVWVGIPATEIL